MNLKPIMVMAGLMVNISVILGILDYLLASNEVKKVNINDEKEIPVKDNSALLDVLLKEEIYIPSACGSKATCGQCKVKVEKGGEEVLPTEEIHLSSREKAEGYRLSCQLKVKDDIDIQLPQELLEAEAYTSEVVDIKDLTHNIKHVFLELKDPQTIAFKPGQYVQLLIPGFEEFRAYSIASPPSQDDLLEFNIRLIPGGLCTTWIHKALEENDEVTFTGPFGDFYLREESDRDIICIGGGAGMAPLRSIIHHQKEKGMPRKLKYYFGARAIKDLYFVEELEKIEKEYANFEYYTALSDPNPDDDWDGETGFITQIVDKYEDSLEDTEAYLCGPPPMLDAAIDVLADKGMRRELILFDKF